MKLTAEDRQVGGPPRLGLVGRSGERRVLLLKGGETVESHRQPLI